jgi:hypothetical protein
VDCVRRHTCHPKPLGWSQLRERFTASPELPDDPFDICEPQAINTLLLSFRKVYEQV